MRQNQINEIGFEKVDKVSEVSKKTKDKKSITKEAEEYHTVNDQP